MKEQEKKEFSIEDAKWAKKTLECRRIVSIINEYGVDEFKRAKIIELLAFELENRDESLVIIEESRKVLEKTQKTDKKIIVT